MKDSLIRPDPGECFKGQKMDGLLNFYGVVKGNDVAAVEGAVVVVFACFADGTERALGATLTDNQGAYLICIPELPDDYGLLGYKVRAGKAYILPEGVDSQGILKEHPDGERELEQVDIPNQEYMFGQEEIPDDNTIIWWKEEHTIEHVTKEADESMIMEPDIEKAAVECTITQEEHGLAVSLNPLDYDFLPVVVVPTVQTDAATDISANSVILRGSIKDTSRDYCDQRKFRIREQGNESWTDAGIETGSFGPESFSFTITGLIPDATYEFKAMAHNLAGWGEGSITTFSAAASPEAPVQVTAAEAESSQRNLRRDTKPPKKPYDIYRSNYWHWLDNKRYDRSKNPQR